MTIIKQTGVQSSGHMKNLRGYIRDGVTEDEEGMVPDDATVAYISTLDRSREERAFELAKHDYYGFLDYKEDRYTTVYGYMD